MSKQYPFFREPDEETQAVIGAEAITSDLNGNYQKPYAILTQKRLYCKNEHGNFIVNTSQLLSAGMPSIGGTGAKLLWIIFGMAAYMIATKLICLFNRDARYLNTSSIEVNLACFGIVCLIVFLVIRVKLPLIASVLLCTYPVCLILVSFWVNHYRFESFLRFLLYYFSDAWYLFGYSPIMGALDWICYRGPIILIVIYCIKNRSMNNNNSMFQIVHTNGAFSFNPKDYPGEELKNFEAQVNTLRKGKANGK